MCIVKDTIKSLKLIILQHHHFKSHFVHSDSKGTVFLIDPTVRLHITVFLMEQFSQDISKTQKNTVL